MLCLPSQSCVAVWVPSSTGWFSFSAYPCKSLLHLFNPGYLLIQLFVHVFWFLRLLKTSVDRKGAQFLACGAFFCSKLWVSLILLVRQLSFKHLDLQFSLSEDQVYNISETLILSQADFVSNRLQLSLSIDVFYNANYYIASAQRFSRKWFLLIKTFSPFLVIEKCI